MAERTNGSVPLVKATLTCKCPQCGRGHLFVGLLKIAKQCNDCGLEFRSQDLGDGAAVFIVLFLGLFLVGMAVAVEVQFGPPMWVHLCLWTPTTIGGSIFSLRPFKALMIALHFKHGLLPTGKANKIS